jgi:hypothetical protein
MKKYLVMCLLTLCVLMLAACGKEEEIQPSEKQEVTFEAAVLEVHDGYCLVKPSDGSQERKSADKRSGILIRYRRVVGRRFYILPAHSYRKLIRQKLLVDQPVSSSLVMLLAFRKMNIGISEFPPAEPSF